MTSFSDPEHTFDAFLKDLFVKIRDEKIDNLIIDLRMNKGGLSSLGDQILSYLTDKPYSQYKRMETLVSQEAREAYIKEAPGFIRWFPIQYFHPMLKPLWEKKIGEVNAIDYPAIEPKENALMFKGRVFVLIDAGSMSSSTMLASTIKTYDLGVLIGEPTGGRDCMYGSVATYTMPNTGLQIEMPSAVIYGNQTEHVQPDHLCSQTVEDLAAKKDSVLALCLRIIEGE
nr:S41 family peptidase [Fusibacter paucivorans]